MDHAEALELIELAAVEPDGLERLMAGDTPGSAIVAGHLAGCAACVAELAVIRRTVALSRDVIAGQPDPALRERTLAFVRAVGRDRSGVAAPVLERAGAGVATAEPGAGPTAPPPRVLLAPPTRPARTARPRWMGLLGLAAALVLAVGAGFVGGVVGAPSNGLTGDVTVLQLTTNAMLALQAQPDTRRVALTATAAGAGASGTLLYSPSTGELLMVATGLTEPPAGQEYGCWIQVDGTKTRIGRMYTGGDLQSWAGPVPGLASLPAGAVFGVSLVPTGGGAGQPLLTGTGS